MTMKSHVNHDVRPSQSHTLIQEASHCDSVFEISITPFIIPLNKNHNNDNLVDTKYKLEAFKEFEI